MNQGKTLKTSVKGWMNCPLKFSGTVSAAIDLVTSLSTEFIDCKVLAFQLNVTDLHELVESNTKAIYEYYIIRTLKIKFQDHMDQGLWIQSEVNKLDMEVDLACYYQQGFMKKTLRLLTEIHKEDVICINNETNVFIYSQGSSTGKYKIQGKLYVYVGNHTTITGG